MHKKLGIYLWVVALIILLSVVGCSSGGNTSSTGDGDAKEADASSEGKSGDKDGDNSADSGEFKEVETFDVEGEIHHGFYLNDVGDTLFWNEQDGFLSNPDETYVWMDGEIEELDFELYDHSAHLHANGKIYSMVTDYDQDNKHYLYVYDPISGETIEYEKNAEPDDYFYVHDDYVSLENDLIAVDATTPEEVNFYLWDYINDEVEMFEITDDIFGIIEEIEDPHQPYYSLSPDGKSLYIMYDEGTVHYDTETGELNEIGVDKFMIVHKISRDSQYAVIADITEEAAGNVVHYKFDRETLELTEIEQDAQGAFYFSLNDGTIILRNDNELYVYDPESNEAALLYDLNLEDNQKLSKYAVSGDGNTIAYAYITETEDSEGKTEEVTSITIVRR